MPKRRRRPKLVFTIGGPNTVYCWFPRRMGLNCNGKKHSRARAQSSICQEPFLLRTSLGFRLKDGCSPMPKLLPLMTRRDSWGTSGPPCWAGQADQGCRIPPHQAMKQCMSTCAYGKLLHGCNSATFFCDMVTTAQQKAYCMYVHACGTAAGTHQ